MGTTHATMGCMKKEVPVRVLVVDDDGMVQATIMKLLEGPSFESESAFSGEEALRLLDGRRFDVICTDLQMPGLSGIDLIHRVRAGSADAAIVLMTGLDHDERVRGAGADAYLHKPFTAEELQQALASALQARGRSADGGGMR